ncbi:multidrug resistance-associated protein 1-like isoform X2 [Haemaphysalis longicornis]
MDSTTELLYSWSTLEASAVATQVLRGFSLVAVILLARQQIHRGVYAKPPGGLCFTLMDAGQVVLLLTSAVVAFVNALYVLEEEWSVHLLHAPTIRVATADFAMAVTLVLVFMVFIQRLLLSLPPSGFCCFITGVLCVSTITDIINCLARMQKKAGDYETNVEIQKTEIIISLVLAFSTAGNFLFAGVRDTIFLHSKLSKVSRLRNEDDSSIFGKITCIGLFPLFRKILIGNEGKDFALPVLRRGMKCRSLATRLSVWITRGRKDGINQRVFMRSIMRVLWPDVVRVVSCTLAYYGCLFAKAPTLELLMASTSRGHATLGAILLLAVSIAESLISCYHMDLLIQFTCRSRAMLQGAIFMKIKQMAAREERIKSLSDLLASVRTVKMYAWEEVFLETVQRLRNVEVSWLYKANLLDGVLDSFYTASSSVMTLLLFCSFYFFKPTVDLTPELSFSCIYLLYMTDLTLNSAALVFRTGRQVSLALIRISKFCTEAHEGKQNDGVTPDADQEKGRVKLEMCTFSWNHPKDQAPPQLEGLSLDILPGSLVGVVGFVGSGKSSLLSAIMGEMRCISGKVICNGSMAYVPQLAHLHNMTLRDNILYGKPMDTEHYEHAITACCLSDDIKKLPYEDLSEVGEKGGNLSGGQKQRLSIARAVFSRSDVYLLDDPLSALDPVVGKMVFHEVIGNAGLLQNKTRIVVCNQGTYLPHMDKLILVHERGIRVYNALHELLADPNCPERLRDEAGHDELCSYDDERLHTKGIEEKDGGRRVAGEEEQKSNETACSILRALIRYSGWPGIVALISFFLGAVALTLEQLCIKTWTDLYSGNTEGQNVSQAYWVDLLVSLCLADVIFRIAGGVLVAMSSRRLSQSLHDEMLAHVLRSPVSLFDDSPRGRILSRFSADMDLVDSRTFLTGKQSVQSVLYTTAKIAVIATQSPQVVAAAAGAAAVIVFGLRLAVQTSYRARQFENTVLSRLLAHVTETLDCLASMRVYGVVRHACHRFCRLADENTRGFSTFCATYKFTRFLSSVCGFAVVLSALLLNVVFVDEWDPSSVGLAMSSASAVPLAMMYLCVLLFTILQMVVSFERCLQYSKLPAEPDVTDEEKEQRKKLSKTFLLDWPFEGGFRFEDYSASYRPGVLPNVLNNVTFTVRPMEKVGVVGRTGAGKSSLLLALLRVLNASQGHIFIDGVDISRVPLKKLRRAITVIPQDPTLLRGTLRMNLDPTNSHTDEELWNALKQANLLPLVSAHPDKLLLETGDGGSNLSVGQRQLVCLARALLRSTRILLLDEATSQMDSDTEKFIQATLRDSCKNSTLLTIAHRLHTVIDYDKILVMDGGRVREFGAVSDLLGNQSSVFYGMAKEAGIIVEENHGFSTDL